MSPLSHQVAQHSLWVNCHHGHQVTVSDSRKTCLLQAFRLVFHTFWLDTMWLHRRVRQKMVNSCRRARYSGYVSDRCVMWDLLLHSIKYHPSSHTAASDGIPCMQYYHVDMYVLSATPSFQTSNRQLKNQSFNMGNDNFPPRLEDNNMGLVHVVSQCLFGMSFVRLLKK